MDKECPDCRGPLKEIKSFLVRQDPKDHREATTVPMYACPKCNHVYQEEPDGSIIRADE
jgi:uncharacterized protein with PIN domain